MTDDAYKARTLVGLQPTRPAIGGLRANSMLRHSPLLGLLRAQDTVPATSRRIVASWSLSGAQDWAQPAGSLDPGDGSPGVPERYPDDSWRTLGPYEAHITPGCELRALVLYCPAGLTQSDAGGGNFQGQGAWAEARVRVTWTNGANTDGPNDHSITMEGSTLGDYTGLENAGAGQNWSTLKRKLITGIRPAEFTSDPTVAVDFSEWTDALLLLQVRGGARVVAFVVFEVPKAHVTDHDNAGLVSVHAVPATNGLLTPMPMTKATDGATYEEHRFGTLRMMQVAERQSERLGPRVLHMSTWNESTISTLTDTEPDPIQTTSVTFLDLYDSSITTYSETNPGWIIAGSNAQLHRLCDPTLIAGGRFAVIPVRVRVDAARGASNGVLRLQSSAHEWVDVTITGSRGWYSAVGYLRSQVFADQSVATCQAFMRSAGGALSVWAVSVDFGHWVS